MGDFLGGITGAIGGLFGNSDRDRATQAWQNAIGNFQGINPNVQTQTQITGDPRTQAIQQQVLQQALQRARAGGLNAIDQGRIADIRNNQEQTARAGQAAAMQNAQAQGTSQGNTGILGALVANQGAADRAQQEGMQAAALGQQSQIASNEQAAGQAGQLRGQNIGVETGNVERGMQQANQNKSNEFEKAFGQLKGTAGLAGQYNDNAANTAAQWRGAGQALGGLASGGLSPWTSWLKGWQGGGGGTPAGVTPGQMSGNFEGWDKYQ